MRLLRIFDFFGLSNSMWNLPALFPPTTWTLGRPVFIIFSSFLTLFTKHYLPCTLTYTFFFFMANLT